MLNIHQYLVYIYTLINLAKDNALNKVAVPFSNYMLGLKIMEILNDRNFKASYQSDKTSTADFLLVISWE
jgi:hypothetical protein